LKFTGSGDLPSSRDDVKTTVSFDAEGSPVGGRAVGEGGMDVSLGTAEGKLSGVSVNTTGVKPTSVSVGRIGVMVGEEVGVGVGVAWRYAIKVGATIAVMTTPINPKIPVIMTPIVEILATFTSTGSS
jgi:hypothetical protein